MDFNVGITSSTITQLSEIGEKVAKFGLSKVEQFYPYLIKQSIINGCIPLFGIILSIILFGIGMTTLYKCPTKKDRYDKDEKDTDSPLFISTIVLCILAGLTLLVSGMSVLCDNSFAHVFNPQYYAIKELIEMVK